MRAGLRFMASVMMVSGALLITDAVVTLLWQEPVSAFVAEREQAALKDALFDPPERVLRREPLEGDAIARIEIPAIGVSEYVVEGTDTGDLRKGPGHYPDTPLPGEPGTSAIAGHRTTYGAPFRDIDDLEPGQVIRVDMPDGRFIYRVQQVKIVDDQDLSVLEPVGYKRLMLSACHPLYSAAERVIVLARQVRREASQVRPARDRRPRALLDGGLVAGLEEQDEADDKGQRQREHGEPVEQLEEHGGGKGTVLAGRGAIARPTLIATALLVVLGATEAGLHRELVPRARPEDPPHDARRAVQHARRVSPADGDALRERFPGSRSRTRAPRPPGRRGGQEDEPRR